MHKLLKKNLKQIDAMIDIALKEDIGEVDITTEITIPAGVNAIGEFAAKDEGIICGLPVAKRIFEKLDREVKVYLRKKDGQVMQHGDVLATVKGKARAILAGERTALNFLQRLSGIATATKKFVDIAKPRNITILDTRKTTPGLRIFEKYAVLMGGGQNHRMGLYDAVLIKDNHLQVVDIRDAAKNMRRWIPRNMKVEIEIDDLLLLDEAIEARPDIIMLDNMTPEMIDKAVEKIKGRVKIEVSGGVNLDNIKELVKRKVDYISIGSITHSPKALDISFNFTTK